MTKNTEEGEMSNSTHKRRTAERQRSNHKNTGYYRKTINSEP